MSSLVCDLTGNNPLFLISDLRYRISKTGNSSVKVVFPQPAFLDGIVIKKLDSNGVVTTLRMYEDYVLDSCLDSEAFNMVKAAYPSFSKNLYWGVYIPANTFGTDNVMDLSVAFQSVFPNILSSAVDVSSNEGGPTCTPELLRAIIQDLCYVKGTISGSASGSIVLLTADNISHYVGRYYPICATVNGTYVTRIVANSDINKYVNDVEEAAGNYTYSRASSLPSPLVTDYTGELPDNYIENEEHYIDTVGGKVIIRPANGAFYGHGVEIRDKNNNVLDDSQYTIRALDMGATKVCEHTSGVWRYIVLTTTAYTGSVYISYHAFGGEVNINNFISLQNEFIELRNYINHGAFLTANNIGGTPVLQEIYERLKTLDRYFRSLNLSGYREMSNRYVATATGNNNSSNWYRVAYLYKQASAATNKETIQLLNSNIGKYVGRVLPLCDTATGSFVDTEIKPSHVGKYVITTSALLDINDNNYFTTYTKDSARFKIRLEKHGIFFDLYVYANVKNSVLKIHAVEADTENGYSKPNSYKSLKSISLPQFRLVWRKDGNYSYGAVLQIKFKIPDNESNEIVLIENHNKAGMGGWILKADNVGTDNVEPENDTVLLPDEIHTWISSGDSDIYGFTEVYPSFKEGTLIWAGSINLNQYDVWDYTQVGTETKPSWKQSTATPLHSCFNGDIDFTSIDNITVTIFDRLDGVYRSFTSKVYAIDENQCAVEYEFDALDLGYLKLKLTKNNGTLVITPEAILGTKSYYIEKFDLRQITINKEISE